MLESSPRAASASEPARAAVGMGLLAAQDGPVRSVLRSAIDLLAAEIKAEGVMHSGTGSGTGRERGVVLVCGTAFIMSEVRAELGVVEPRDGDVLSTTGGYWWVWVYANVGTGGYRYIGVWIRAREGTNRCGYRPSWVRAGVDTGGCEY